MTTAVVFVPSADYDLHANICITYCEQFGYRLGGIVRDDLLAALGMLASRTADVLVVARREHLDQAPAPRMEVVSEAGTQLQDMAELITEDRAGRLRRRRPRLIKRTAAPDA